MRTTGSYRATKSCVRREEAALTHATRSRTLLTPLRKASFLSGILMILKREPKVYTTSLKRLHNRSATIFKKHEKSEKTKPQCQ